jgi:hypothetical protein
MEMMTDAALFWSLSMLPAVFGGGKEWDARVVGLAALSRGGCGPARLAVALSPPLKPSTPELTCVADRAGGLAHGLMRGWD